MKKSGFVSILQIVAHAIILRPFLRFFFGVNAIGRDNIRGLKQCIMIANHNSHLDVCLLFTILSLRDIPRTHAVAAREYFSTSRFVYLLVKFFFNPIFITRGDKSDKEDPLLEIKKRLEHGDNIIVFPEGTRGDPGVIQHFKSGIGRLVVHFPQVPIVPVFIAGTERGLPRSTMLLLPFWMNLVVGPPKLLKGKHREITHLLEETIKELSQSFAAVKHKRRKHKAPPKSIALLGIDGSGKSTISRMAALELSMSSSVCRLSDKMAFYEKGAERNIQPLITERVRKKIGSYAKKAGSLKNYKIPKLTELLLRNHLFHEAGRWYSPDIIIMDGAPLLNIVAWAALYKKGLIDKDVCVNAVKFFSGKCGEVDRDDPIFKEFPELKYLRGLRMNNLVLPDMVVFIDVEPGVSCERIMKRGEQRQVHETEEKLGLLREAYLMVCDVIRDKLGVSVLIVDGTGNPEDISRKVMQYIRGHVENNEGTV